MSDELTITLRGQEAYDYIQWRAERYKQEQEERLRELELSIRLEED